MYSLTKTGKRIYQLRKENKLTQEKLAEKVGTSTDHIGKIEKGREGASIDLLIELAACFEVSLDFLILGKENEKDRIKAAMGKLLGEMEVLQKQL